ncbi:MAG: hypothetical protein IIY96_01075, partial [Lachnospiraceae bacterium]|nr:hypothetical protein [Lachnospiraceae bacterium]
MKKATSKLNNKALAALTLGMTLHLLAFPAASAPTYDNLPEGMTAERLTKLNDSTIEWDEIEDLVIYWNPTYTMYLNSAESNVSEMKAG